MVIQKKILFISIAWPKRGQANLYTDLMEEFVAQGHDVFVVGTKDADLKMGSDLSKERGMKVVRVASGQIRKASYLRKIRSLIVLGTKMKKAINKHYSQYNFDLIIGPTPPITLSYLYKSLKKKYNSPFYLLLKDIWPQGSVDLKVFRKYSLPWFFFRSHEKRIYKEADFIGCMSPKGAKYVISNNGYIEPSKVEVCPNSIRPKEKHVVIANNDIRQKYNIPSDACVFLFSGNLGIGHGLHFIVDTLKKLLDYPKAYFVIGGSGTQYNYLENELNKLQLKNALLYSWLPREDYEQILQTSDVGLIFLYRYTSPQFPSRLLSYLEYAKPVLCAVNKETDIGEIVTDYGCGRSVIHGEMADFIKEIKFFSENSDEREQMGEKGRQLLLERYTVKHSYDIIMKHLNA
ncbi:MULTISPECIES: glycosyltransferase family 4 protein [unclassified Carboxylicivirga]|uniref:glycosyltransferase family 4 protein n=1 Tax=Carboxylicivirga TaxID=1628153 RepID=UPI003D357E23